MRDLINRINLLADQCKGNEIKIMEVCGTHTQMISKLGVRSVLSSKIKLLSGPGCPVCVTNEEYIDTAIALLNQYDITLATFGDLLRVKGSMGSLLDEKRKGKHIIITHSPLELISLAESNPQKRYVFLGVGFETTAPVIALAIKTAYEKKIHNLHFLTSIKRMPPILHYIFQQKSNQINGLLCPGHVAAIAGMNYFRFLEKKYQVPGVICGFESYDILQGIHILMEQICGNKKICLVNEYQRFVRASGNLTAIHLMEEVYRVMDGEWRGIGWIENSFLAIQEKYADMDALIEYKIDKFVNHVKHKNFCECGNILLGNKTPKECILFSKVCNPLNPHGPCMVSTEGACAIAYRYKEGI